jgi:HK97 family phage portal protein
MANMASLLNMFARKIYDRWGGSSAMVGYFYDGQDGTQLPITPDSAMRLSTVYAVVRVAVETISTLPVFLVEKEPDKKGRRIVHDHPVARLLRQPNKKGPWVNMCAQMQTSIEHTGNSFVEVERNRRRDPIGLHPVSPFCVSVKEKPRTLQYFIQNRLGREVPVRQGHMMHTRNVLSSETSVMGVSWIQNGANDIGLGLAATRYGGKVFSSGGMQRTALVSEKSVGPELAKEILTKWKATYGGERGMHDVALLHSGMKTEKIGVNPKDAQLLQLLQANLFTICAMARMQPTMIMDMSEAKWANITEQSIAFVRDSIMPRTTLLEKTMNFALLDDDPRFSVKFNLKGLLRGDPATRMKFYVDAITNGIMNAEEIRELEDMDPYEGADQFWMPVNNLAPVEQVLNPPQGIRPAGDRSACGCGAEHRTVEGDTQTRAYKRAQAAPRRNLRREFMPVFKQIYDKILKFEKAEISKAMDKFLTERTRAQFDAWLREFQKRDEVFSKANLAQAVKTYENLVAGAALKEINIPEIEAALKEYIENWSELAGQRRAAKMAGDIEGLLVDKNLEESLTALKVRMDTWTEQGDVLARKHTVQSESNISREAWKRSGVTTIVWEGGDCDFCSQLNGQVVGIEDKFVDAQGGIEVPGKSTMFVGGSAATGSGGLLNPPLHNGCDCYLTPGG